VSAQPLADHERVSVATGLAEGWTLPASWYTDDAILALERERIFARSWQYVGRAEQVAKPGDFFASRAGHIPVAVVRDEDGNLGGFVNVCRHRGHQVVVGEGNRRTLQCPYHAWTYGLDGCLRAVPRREREHDLPVEELSLRQVQVDSWGPFVFVNPDLDAAPLAEALGDVPTTVAETGFDLDSLEFEGRWEWTVHSNWKVAIENYLECYHCPTAHPGFSELLDVDPDEYTLSTGLWTSSQRTHVRPAILNGNKAGAYDPRGGSTEAQYHLVWPNFTVNVEAGVPNIGVDVWWPDGPDRTAGVSDRWFAPEVPKTLREEMIAFARQVGLEDNGLCESVHRGLASGMVPRGRILRESEQLIAHFQGLVFEALAG
jgi:phenylpropionate dioxygenase-like ring-hydroxylating dioxygenase large terminal subunit